MLKCNFSIRNLPRACLTAKLPIQLCALCYTRCPNRVTFGDKTATWIYDPASTKGCSFAVHELMALSLMCHTQTFVCDQLIRCKAVMQLDNLNIVRSKTSLLVDLFGCPLTHFGSNCVDTCIVLATLKCRREIGRHRLPNDLHGLALKSEPFHGILAHQHSRSSSVARRAALQLRQRCVRHRCISDLLLRVLVTELRVGIVDRVLVILPPDPSKMLRSASVYLHVLSCCITKHPRHGWGLLHWELCEHRLEVTINGSCPLWRPIRRGTQRARLHDFHTKGQANIMHASCDEVFTKEQCVRSCGACIGDIMNRNTCPM